MHRLCCKMSNAYVNLWVRRWTNLSDESDYLDIEFANTFTIFQDDRASSAVVEEINDRDLCSIIHCRYSWTSIINTTDRSHDENRFYCHQNLWCRSMHLRFFNSKVRFLYLADRLSALECVQGKIFASQWFLTLSFDFRNSFAFNSSIWRYKIHKLMSLSESCRLGLNIVYAVNWLIETILSSSTHSLSCSHKRHRE